MTQTTEPDPSDYTALEKNLAKGMNERAYADHEAELAKDRWTVFLPHARAAIETLIDMGITLG
jgi:hypothetical protein